VRRGRYREAVTELEKSLAFAPNEPDTYLNLGHAFAGMHDVAAARQCFQRVLTMSPEHPDAMFNLGVLSMEDGNLDVASAWFERVVAQYPAYADAHVNLGIIRQRQGDVEDAIKRFRRAIDIDPRLPHAHFNLGQALNAQGRIAESVDCYKRTLLLEPANAEARWALAVSRLSAFYNDEREMTESRAAFAAALEELSKWLSDTQPADAYKAVGTLQPFLLAYHETNNRDLLRLYGELCAAAMATWFERQQAGNVRAAA
jgi:tetratricopeptide (TPR) repeat protein